MAVPVASVEGFDLDDDGAWSLRLAGAPRVAVATRPEVVPEASVLPVPRRLAPWAARGVLGAVPWAGGLAWLVEARWWEGSDGTP